MTLSIPTHPCQHMHTYTMKKMLRTAIQNSSYSVFFQKERLLIPQVFTKPSCSNRSPGVVPFGSCWRDICVELTGRLGSGRNWVQQVSVVSWVCVSGTVLCAEDTVNRHSPAPCT